MFYKYLLSALLLSAPSLANTVYTWEDSKGTRHFSDSPPAENSSVEQVFLSSSDSIEAPFTDPTPSKKTTASKKKQASSEATLKALDISISNLGQEETIRSSRGYITVLTDLTRKLEIDEKLQLLLDGSPYGLPQTSTEWKLKNIQRGTHLITVVAQKDGKRIASSPIITVYLHRPSAK